MKDKGVVVLGIHTPETKQERDLTLLRRKVEEAKISYPVAADNQQTNWNRWKTQYWPSIYLVDKKGVARTAWFGEVKWKGGGVDGQLRKRIEELLSEK